MRVLELKMKRTEQRQCIFWSQERQDLQAVQYGLQTEEIQRNPKFMVGAIDLMQILFSGGGGEGENTGTKKKLAKMLMKSVPYSCS